MEAGEFLSLATHACTWCTKTMPKEREVDLVHHEPCHRSIDQHILVYREPRSRPQPRTEPVWSPDKPRGWPPRATCGELSLAQIQP